MAAFAVGADLLLGTLLVSAGLMKLLRPRAFMHALVRLLPSGAHWRVRVAKAATLLIALAEIVVAAGLLGVAWLPPLMSLTAAIAGALLYCGFVLVLAVAVRKGAACGCWSSFSDGPAGGAELGRAVALATLALTALVVRSIVGPQAWVWAALVWAGVLAVAIGAAAAVGSKIGKRPDPRKPERIPKLAAREAAFLLGRVTSDKSVFALPTTVKLRGAERDRLVALAKSTPTWRALEDWLHANGASPDWPAVTVMRSTARRSGRRIGHVQFVLPAAPDGELLLSLQLQGEGLGGVEHDQVPGDLSAFGKVGGRRLTAMAGRVSFRSDPPIRVD